MTPTEERVLVIPTEILHQAGLFHGFSTDVEHYLPRLLDPVHMSFLPRSHVETDPTFKQIIPYVVFRHIDHVFHYQRGGDSTERRLRALRSIGVGGHISEDDTHAADPYRAGMLREVEEEVYLNSPYQEACIGLINDDRTPVGQVHLGIVHVFELEEPKVQCREAVIANSGFAPWTQLQQERDAFETWSQFLLDDGLMI